MSTLAIILFCLYVAISSVMEAHLWKARDKYRTAWKREMETSARLRKERAQSQIESVGLRAEVIRLKTERDRIAREQHEEVTRE